MAGSGAVPFVGRSADLSRLRQAIAAGAVGSLILLEGEAGLGKSRLVQEALATATDKALRVYGAKGQELESTRPFGIIADALAVRPSSSDPNLSEMVSLLYGTPAGAEGSDGPPGAGVSHRIVEAVVALLERLADTGPVILALEDVHWADPSTLLTVHAIGRRCRSLPVTTICTFRPAPRRAELERLIANAAELGATHIILRDLAAEEVEDLASAVAGGRPGPGLQAQLSRCRGNPFYCIELVRALMDEGALDVAGGTADTSGTTLRPSLRRVLLQRLGYLPDDVLAILRLAAVLGSTFDVTQLAIVCRRPLVELTDLLDGARRAGIVGEAGSRLCFRHDLIREALYTDLTQAVRTGLHREVGRALAAAGAPPMQVADHLVLSASTGDGEAAEWIERAAREAQPGAPAVAASLFERALNIAGPGSGRRDILRVELLSALIASGQLGAAEAEARRILAGHPAPDSESAARIALTNILLGQGRMVEASDERARALLSPGLTPKARARIAADSVFAQVLAQGVGPGAAAAQNALTEAERLEESAAQCSAVCGLVTVAILEGRFEAAVTHACDALDRAGPPASRTPFTLHTEVFLGWALGDAEQSGAAEDALQRGRRMCDELGVPLGLPTYHFLLARHYFLTGSWDDAVAEAEAGLALPDEGWPLVCEPAARSILSLIATHRNDVRSAARLAATAEAALASSGPQPLASFAAIACAASEEARGNVDVAVPVLLTHWEEWASRGHVGEFLLAGPTLIRMLRTAGDEATARWIADAVGKVAEGSGMRWARGAERRCRGLAYGEPAALLEAVAVLRYAPRPLDLGLACQEAATALADRDPNGAGALLDDAMAVFQRLGARRDEAQVVALLRRLGQRPSRRGWKQRQAKVGWEALTRTENEVVGLVGQGFTNRDIAENLFISPRTVETHLNHVFAKLDISSRVELRHAAAVRSVETGRPAIGSAPR